MVGLPSSHYTIDGVNNSDSTPKVRWKKEFQMITGTSGETLYVEGHRLDRPAVSPPSGVLMRSGTGLQMGETVMLSSHSHLT